MLVGIESFAMYTSHYYLDLKTLAAQRGEDPAKYLVGIGQERMAAPPPDEDTVTLAANAAAAALEGIDAERIDTLLLATESGVDHSKAAAAYVHGLLGLPKNMRVIELKQACYAGAGGLMLALPYLRQHPEQKVLLVAADIARYGLGAAGEPTQGAGAAAMVLSAEPRILSFDMESGLYTADEMDFWRPVYRDEALVDGKYSVKVYLRALHEAWEHYLRRGGRRFEEFYRFVYHLPFAKMGEKAHAHLLKHAGGASAEGDWLKQIADGVVYQRTVGNSYAASVFIALLSLLECSRRRGFRGPAARRLRALRRPRPVYPPQSWHDRWRTAWPERPPRRPVQLRLRLRRRILQRRRSARLSGRPENGAAPPTPRVA